MKQLSTASSIGFASSNDVGNVDESSEVKEKEHDQSIEKIRAKMSHGYTEVRECE